jgi:hypothetical protein
MVLLHIFFFFFFFFLLANKTTTVRARVRCSRCTQRDSRIAFPTWVCTLPETWESPTCDAFCPYGPFGDDTSTYSCYVFPPLEQQDQEQQQVACYCALSGNAFLQPCPPGKQTAAYRCDDTLYVCWNMVPPQVLDLVDDTGNACPLTNSPLTDLVYCDGGGPSLFNFDTQRICGNWCDTAESATHCPNGKAIDGTFKITAPLTRSGTVTTRIENQGIFCDYGGIYITDDWVVDRPIVPTFYSCPPDVMVGNDPGMCHAVVNYAEPECKVNYRLLEGSESGTPFNVADVSHPVRFDATVLDFKVVVVDVDTVAVAPANVKETCAFTVTVEDVEPPIVTCPDDMYIMARGNQCFSVATYDPPWATDNCGLDLSQVKILPNGFIPSGGIFPAGVTTITMDAADSSDNRSTCSFQVQVNTHPSVDCSQVPIITCPANLIIRQDPAICGGAVVIYSVTSQNPNNARDTILPVQVKGLPSGSLFPIGTTEMLFTASLVVLGTGSNSGIVGCSFTVSVLEAQTIPGKKGGPKCKKFQHNTPPTRKKKKQRINKKKKVALRG